MSEDNIEKLKQTKRWFDQFAADHPRVMWIWALSVSAWAVILWIGNKVFC